MNGFKNKIAVYILGMTVLYLLAANISGGMVRGNQESMANDQPETAEKIVPVSSGEDTVRQSSSMDEGFDLYAKETKKVALTFDDGPGPDTDRLLAGLKERNVQAAFFVVGEKAEQYPETIKKMHEDGHIIGNHTYHHTQLNTVLCEAAMEEVEQTNQLIQSLTGERPDYLRPPYGECREAMREQLDMVITLWDVDPLDWCTLNADIVTGRVVQNVKENSIILLHDIYDTSVDAALRIVDTLKEQGYEFVTVEEILFP